MDIRKVLRWTIAVDFDGTLCEHKFPEIGEPNKELINILRQLPQDSYEIIIHTCRILPELRADGISRYGRDFVKEMEEWLKEYNIPYSSIWTGEGKPIASIYIDDRAFNPITSSMDELRQKLKKL